VLRNRQLTAVVTARFVSLTGTNMTVVALPWFVLATTGSAARMGLVLAFQTIPSVVLGVPAGAVVAALGPRRALVLADTLRAPLLAAVPLCSWLGVLSFPLLLLLVTAIGIFSVPYAAASNAILPELVGENEAEVARATAALQVAIQTTGVIGPVLAGVLIALIGSTAILLFDAASYALSAAIVALFVHAGRAVAGAARRGVLVGVQRIRHDALLASLVAAVLAAHLALAALFATLPTLAFRTFNDARTAGLLFAADAIGSVLGGFLARSLARRTRPMLLALIGFAAMTAPIWILTASVALPVATVSMFVFGIGGPLAVAPISATLTLRAPASIRPQVVSAFFAITSAGTPLGAAGAGFAIEQLGFPATYVGIAATMTLATVMLWAVSRRAQTGAAPAAAPEPA
jgi:MFS family permease